MLHFQYDRHCYGAKSLVISLHGERAIFFPVFHRKMSYFIIMHYNWFRFLLFTKKQRISCEPHQMHRRCLGCPRTEMPMEPSCFWCYLKQCIYEYESLCLKLDLVTHPTFSWRTWWILYAKTRMYGFGVYVLRVFHEFVKRKQFTK